MIRKAIFFVGSVYISTGVMFGVFLRRKQYILAMFMLFLSISTLMLDLKFNRKKD